MDTLSIRAWLLLERFTRWNYEFAHHTHTGVIAHLFILNDNLRRKQALRPGFKL